jgi:hypothetical protein
MNSCKSVNKVVATLIVLVMSLATAWALVPSASAEPYEDSTLIGDLAAPRAGATTGIGLDGRVYVFGGGIDSGFAAVDTVMIFDPETGETTYGTPMPAGSLVSGIVRAANGSFLLIGGYSQTLGALANVQIYDPVADSWSAGALMPKNLFWLDACMGADSKVYVLGGKESGNSTLIYNPTTNTWSYGANMTTPRWGTKSALLSNGSIMVMGGMDYGGAYDLVEFYTPSTDSWSAGVNMASPRGYGGVVLARNGFVYYFGGQSSWGVSDNSAYGDVERLELAGGVSWESISGYQLASFGMVLDSYGRAILLGGWNGANVLTPVHMYFFADISSPYQIVITNPEDGSIVSGVVTVQAEVVNWMGGGLWAPLMGIDLFIDDVLYESQAGGWSGSFLWNASSLVDGSEHTLMVRGYHWDGKVVEDSATVTVSRLSVEEKLAALELQLADVQTQLADLQTQLTIQNANLTSLRAQVVALQTLLTGLQTGMTQMGANQTAAMDALRATLADLQLQLDALQEQTDSVETKADNGGTYGMVTLVLVIVVIALLAMMFMMGRKKP